MSKRLLNNTPKNVNIFIILRMNELDFDTKKSNRY